MYVLLVEGESALGGLWQDRLGRAGHEVEWAATLGSAISSVSLRTFDVVILDLILPDGGGFDFLGLDRDHGLTARTIVVAEPGKAHAAHRAGLLGVPDYLEKPVAVSELIALVHRVGAAAAENTAKGQIIWSAIDRLRQSTRNSMMLAPEVRALYLEICTAPDVSLRQFQLAARALHGTAVDPLRTSRERVLARLEEINAIGGELSTEVGRVLSVVARSRLIKGGDIARVCGMSEGHLAEVLRSTGRDVRKWARLARVRRALIELRLRNRTPSEAAVAAGYNSVQQCGRDFKAEFAALPSQFARRTPAANKVSGRKALAQGRSVTSKAASVTSP